MAKLIYIAKRNPKFTREQFIARWRKHGALAMSQQLWRQAARYVQASSIPSPSIEGASETYDAVGVLWFKDDSHMVAPTPADVADVAEMAQDEFETFAGPVAPGRMRVDEQELSNRGAGRTTAYLFFFDVSAAQRAAERAASRNEAHRVVLNTARAHAERGLAYSAAVEIAALDLVGLQRALGDGGLLDFSPDLAIVAREAVLWE
jgi:hypothetical protein